MGKDVYDRGQRAAPCRSIAYDDDPASRVLALGRTGRARFDAMLLLVRAGAGEDETVIIGGEVVPDRRPSDAFRP